MARLVTLAKLRGLARLYADQRPGGADAFVPDTDGGTPSVASVNDLVNLAIAEFYDLLTAARGHEYARSTFTLSMNVGLASSSLPDDFYEALSVVLEWGPSDHEIVESLERVRSREAFTNFVTWTSWGPKAYRIYNTLLEFVPLPTSVPPSAKLYYIPTAPILLLDVSTIDCVNGWEKLVALRVAMELRTIEEMPYADLERLFDREKERIMEMASERQAAMPKQVQDVQPEGGNFWPFVRRRDP